MLVIAKQAVREPRRSGSASSRRSPGATWWASLVAHELTHALQDQHWGLPTDDASPRRRRTRRSPARAPRAARGRRHARRPSPTCRGGTLDDDDRWHACSRQMHGHSRGARERAFPTCPTLLRDALAFQYEDGTSFVAGCSRAAAGPPSTAAQADPPDVDASRCCTPSATSTARDEPTSVVARGHRRRSSGGLDARARRHPRRARRAVPRRPQRSRPSARRGSPRAGTAIGWWRSRAATICVVAWMTAWDTERDAVEFADAIPQRSCRPRPSSVAATGARAGGTLPRGPVRDPRTAAAPSSRRRVSRRAGSGRRPRRRRRPRARASSGEPAR